MNDILSTKDAAQILHLSEPRVRQLCQQGRLGTKVGRQWIITSAELKAFKNKPRPDGRPHNAGR